MITMTEKAREALKRMQTEEGAGSGSMLRITVLAGGCSGMSYKLSFDDKPATAGDKVLDCGDVKIVVDAKTGIYIKGMEIDYSGGLNGSGFVFRNPNAKEVCGCGTSFNV